MPGSAKRRTEDIVEQYFHTPSEKQMQASFYITWAGRRRCQPNHRIGPRILDNYKIVFVAGGSGFLQQAEGELRPVSAGDMFVLFPREKHFYYTSPQNPWELVWVSFNGASCREVLKEMGFSRTNDLLPNAYQRPLRQIMHELLGSMAQEEGQNDSLRSVGMLHLMLAEIQAAVRAQARARRQTPLENQRDTANRAVRFIEENYYLPIHMETLCAHVNYSRSHISRLFNDHVGLSVPAYITRVRLQNARRLLETTSLSVKEVAASVGIDDPFYFSKLFKRETGVPPALFRQKSKNK